MLLWFCIISIIFGGYPEGFERSPCFSEKEKPLYLPKGTEVSRRAGATIKNVIGQWDSNFLIQEAFAIIAEELMGYRVIFEEVVRYLIKKQKYGYHAC